MEAIRRRKKELIDKNNQNKNKTRKPDNYRLHEKVLVHFSYLGRILHWLDDDWPAVLRKILKVRQVWWSLGKLLRQEGAEPFVSEKFYRTVVQAVLLFGADTWVPTSEMSQNIEGAYVGFLKKLTGENMRGLGGESWQKVAADSVLQSAGTQPLRTYIDKMQAEVAERVASRLIFEVYTKDNRY